MGHISGQKQHSYKISGLVHHWGIPSGGCAYSACSGIISFGSRPGISADQIARGDHAMHGAQHNVLNLFGRHAGLNWLKSLGFGLVCLDL